MTGQALNAGVYSALGVTGTYYGVRFGEHVPWVTGFPYNLGISDPQYIGSIMTIVAMRNLLQFDPFFEVVLILNYLFMMWVESAERTPRYNKQSKAQKPTNVVSKPKTKQRSKSRATSRSRGKAKEHRFFYDGTSKTTLKNIAAELFAQYGENTRFSRSKDGIEFYYKTGRLSGRYSQCAKFVNL